MIELADSAKLDYIKCQREQLDAYHIANILVHQNSNSQFKLWQLAHGAALYRDDVTIQLNGVDATAQLYGLYQANQQQHMDMHITVNHNCPQTTSEQLYKGIFDDQAKGVFNGKVLVKPNAQQIVAIQRNNNLLLSRTAEMNTKPELEIYADSVKCSHGATVGQLDHDSLFYLQSRGLDIDMARQLLTQAFLQEVIDTLPDVCRSLKC